MLFLLLIRAIFGSYQNFGQKQNYPFHSFIMFPIFLLFCKKTSFNWIKMELICSLGRQMNPFTPGQWKCQEIISYLKNVAPYFILLTIKLIKGCQTWKRTGAYINFNQYVFCLFFLHSLTFKNVLVSNLFVKLVVNFCHKMALVIIECMFF